jgi:hypothetical protein
MLKSYLAFDEYHSWHVDHVNKWDKMTSRYVIIASWDVIPCNLVYRRCFGGTCYFYLQDRRCKMEATGSAKHPPQ